MKGDGQIFQLVALSLISEKSFDKNYIQLDQNCPEYFLLGLEFFKDGND